MVLVNSAITPQERDEEKGEGVDLRIAQARQYSKMKQGSKGDARRWPPQTVERHEVEVLDGGEDASRTFLLSGSGTGVAREMAAVHSDQAWLRGLLSC